MPCFFNMDILWTFYPTVTAGVFREPESAGNLLQQGLGFLAKGQVALHQCGHRVMESF